MAMSASDECTVSSASPSDGDASVDIGSEPAANVPTPSTVDGSADDTETESDDLDQKIYALRHSIVYRVPIVDGTLAVAPSQEIKLFYGKPGDAHCLDLAHPTEEQLCALEAACDRATFGRNQQDVLDETYRKAGKMDTSNFSTNFSPPSSVLGLVRDELLERRNMRLVYSLYKLNVYGKDSFFKPHKDTPRGSCYFGTLIVIFPAPHEGGELVFDDGEHEWTVDAASEILKDGQPHLVYAAFYGDVTHEVRKVTSGHRVTLTWNIFCENEYPEPPETPSPVLLGYMDQPKQALSALLNDERLLPNGGYLGFGLRYLYPVEDRSWLNARYLRGGDAMIRSVCEDLNLEVSVLFAYGCEAHGDIYDILNERKDAYFVSTHATELDCLDGYTSVWEMFSEHTVIRNAGTPPVFKPHARRRRRNEEEVVWVTEYLQKNQFSEQFLAYGNEAYVDTIYGAAALFVKVDRRSSEHSAAPGGA